MLDALLAADQSLFEHLNGVWHHPWLDALMPHWRNKKTWIPLYLVLVLLLTRTYRWKVGWILLGVGLTILLADQTSSFLLKPWVGRLRPCHALEEVQLLVHCGSGFSFPSSHASNHFALVAILYGLLRPAAPAWVWGMFWAWAASIAYGQVYVGVHYPLDALGGALLGTAIGLGLAWVLLRFKPYQQLSSDL